MNEILPYVDGWFGPERELTVIPRPEFPFKTNPNPDTYSRVYNRDFQVQPRQFIPKVGNRSAWTNLILRSEEMNDAAWTKTNLTVTANAGTAPDGQATLDKLLETATTGEHAVTQAATPTAVPQELSVFAVAGLTRQWIRLLFTDSAATAFSAFFNVLSGYAISPTAGTTAKIVSLGNGQFRCVINFTPAAGAGAVKVNVSTDGSTVSYAGNTANGVFLWGVQLSAGTDTPYISTTGTTRAITAPDRDPLDPFAFLVLESDPQPQTSETEFVRRMFARIPKQQIIPGSIFVTKPSIPGTFPQFYGDFIVVQPDPSVGVYDQYVPQTVIADSGPLIGGGAPTGGAYTLSFAGDTTTPIAFNAGPAAVASALNALSTIIAKGGVAVTGSYTAGFLVAFNAITLATPGMGSLTTAGGTPYLFQNSSQRGYTDQMCILTTTGQDFTGGTFTVTLLGQTAGPFAFNENSTVVIAALNALSNVTARGGIVNGGSGSVLIQTNFISVNYRWQPNALITVDATTLTPSGSSGTAVGSYFFNIDQTITFVAGTGSVRIIETAAPHGISILDNIVVKAGAVFYAIAAGTFTVPSTTTIGIPAAASTVSIDPSPISIVGKKFGASYTAGTKLTRCNRITDFFLPGVSPGITTADDIPLPPYEGDPTSLLTAIFAGETSINYEVGELQQWKESPILMRTITTLNAATL